MPYTKPIRRATYPVTAPQLFPTLFRHDPIYYVRMKLNKAFVSEYPHLWRWLCRVYALPGVARNSPLAQMKQGYFGRSGNNNIPVGPELGGRPWLERLAEPEYGAKMREARRMVDAQGLKGLGLSSLHRGRAGVAPALASAALFSLLGAAACALVMQRRS